MKATPKRVLATIISFALLSCITTITVYAQGKASGKAQNGDTIQLSANPDIYAITIEKDIAYAEKIMSELLPYKDGKSTGELMVMAAKKLLGNSYVAGTLDAGDSEDVRVYLSKTDCIIFVETCMNLVLTVKEYGAQADFEKLCQKIRQSRYRRGEVRCYSDRIHYTTEWIRQGELRGILQDITLKVGGEVYEHPIFYMTKNYKRYKHLKDANIEDTSDISKATKDYFAIARVEAELNSEPYTYIPQNKIKKCEQKIENGDIIGYMSTTDGLDIAHVAIAYWRKDGKLGFIHASFGEKKVVIDKKTIAEYANTGKNINGIKVIRVK